MHQNPRFNIIQAEGNCSPNFVVIDGQRTDSGHMVHGGLILTAAMPRDAAIAQADALEIFSLYHPLVRSRYVSYGRLFDTFAFATPDAANAFMTAMPDWGMIGTSYDGLHHVARNSVKGQPLPRIQTLLCACCGAVTQGRQWHNRDTGYGLCETCVPFVADKTEDLERGYGFPNVHYAIHPNQGA